MSTDQQVNPNTAIVCGTLLLLGVLGGVFALAWHGVVTGGQVVGVAMAVMGIAAVGFGIHSTANVVKTLKAPGPS